MCHVNERDADYPVREGAGETVRDDVSANNGRRNYIGSCRFNPDIPFLFIILNLTNTSK